jgi:hypothetical protein
MFDNKISFEIKLKIFKRDVEYGSLKFFFNLNLMEN